MSKKNRSATKEQKNGPVTYGVLKGGGATEDEVLNSGEEGCSFLGLGLEVLRSVEALDVFLEILNIACDH